MTPYECAFGVKPRMPDVPGSSGRVSTIDLERIDEEDIDIQCIDDHTYAGNSGQYT